MLTRCLLSAPACRCCAWPACAHACRGRSCLRPCRPTHHNPSPGHATTCPPPLQFRSNMSDFKVHENTQLLVQFRDNILAIINAMEAMGGVMAQMPQLPVR